MKARPRQERSSAARCESEDGVRYASTMASSLDDAARLGMETDFVAEDEGFLDAVASALDGLVADCKAALQRSHGDMDIEAVILAAEGNFADIAAICNEAGLVVSTIGNDAGRECYGQDFMPAAVESPCSSVSIRRESFSSWSNASAETCALQNSCYEPAITAPVHPPPASIHTNMTEEIVEVELSDLLAQSHEHASGIQRALEERMNNTERARLEYERSHAEEMRVLREELVNSRLAVDVMKQELLEGTNQKLEEMRDTITASQRAIEAGMKEQARYWKAICQELVVEKREMAQRVAEERGKYTALKARLASHDGADPASESRGVLSSTRDEDRVAPDLLYELSPRSALSRLQESSSGTNLGSNGEPAAFPTPPIVVVPNAECVSEPSSAEVSPTHSSSSSRSDKSTFRRYYLAQKRVVLH